jgi:hypothetical protein
MSKAKRMSLNLIHYGDDTFSLSKFKPIQDESQQGWVKPKGGLWTSPVDSKFGWKHWCKAEDFAIDLEHSFQLKLEGNVIVIDCEADLEKLCWRNVSNWFFWEPLLAEGVDAVYLTEEGQWKTRFSRPRSLYGWDCESVLVMNPKCVVQCY